ncbi:Katanin p60 ATPase-containing subunit A-like 1 [Manis javanica]|nr:Katanin p60 ATPase-containing subunit A-like 1 [Manis javanica]
MFRSVNFSKCHLEALSTAFFGCSSAQCRPWDLGLLVSSVHRRCTAGLALRVTTPPRVQMPHKVSPQQNGYKTEVTPLRAQLSGVSAGPPLGAAHPVWWHRRRDLGRGSSGSPPEPCPAQPLPERRTPSAVTTSPPKPFSVTPMSCEETEAQEKTD